MQIEHSYTQNKYIIKKFKKKENPVSTSYASRLTQVSVIRRRLETESHVSQPRVPCYLKPWFRDMNPCLRAMFQLSWSQSLLSLRFGLRQGYVLFVPVVEMLLDLLRRLCVYLGIFCVYSRFFPEPPCPGEAVLVVLGVQTCSMEQVSKGQSFPVCWGHIFPVTPTLEERGPLTCSILSLEECALEELLVACEPVQLLFSYHTQVLSCYFSLVCTYSLCTFYKPCSCPGHLGESGVGSGYTIFFHFGYTVRNNKGSDLQSKYFIVLYYIAILPLPRFISPASKEIFYGVWQLCKIEIL